MSYPFDRLRSLLVAVRRDYLNGQHPHPVDVLARTREINALLDAVPEEYDHARVCDSRRTASEG